MSTYNIDECEVQSVTTIIGAQSDKSALIKWSARMTAEWIKEFSFKDYCEEEPYWEVDLEDLKKAKGYYKEESDRAMQIGSNVHKYIERFLNARK